MKIYDDVVTLIPHDESNSIPDYVLSILELVKNADDSEEELNEQILKLNEMNSNLLSENQRLRDVNIKALLSSDNSDEDSDEDSDEEETELESFESIREEYRKKD